MGPILCEFFDEVITNSHKTADSLLILDCLFGAPNANGRILRQCFCIRFTILILLRASIRANPIPRQGLGTPPHDRTLESVP